MIARFAPLSAAERAVLADVACGAWYLGQPEAARFQQFNAWMCALDAILPAAETGQLDAWTPDQRHPLAALAQAAVYALKVVGWALSLLAVAGFAGLVRTR